jgi:hypothetical protein
MELNVEHNLTEDELFKAIVSLAKSSGLQERVHESLAKALPGCDCTEKEPRDPVIKELKRRTFDVFWQEARTGIADTVEKILTGDHDSSWLDLFKAKPARVYPSGPLTREQVQAIQQAIRDRFNYIAATLDSDYRPDDLTLRRWKKQGIVDTSVTASDFAATIPGSLRAVKNAFVFGRMHLAIEKGARTYDDILRVALTAPLTKPDTYAVQVAEQQAAKYVTQFGEHLATETVNLALAKNRQIVKDMTIKLHQHTLKQVPLNDFAEEKHVAPGSSSSPSCTTPWTTRRGIGTGSVSTSCMMPSGTGRRCASWRSSARSSWYTRHPSPRPAPSASTSTSTATSPACSGWLRCFPMEPTWAASRCPPGAEQSPATSGLTERRR